MSPRLKILLVPNVAAWIIGEMATHIMERFRNEFDFYFFPESLLWRRPDLYRALLPHLNLVHCLNESSVPLIRDLGAPQPPIITWIHHVTQWSPLHELAVRESSALVTGTPGWKSAIENFSGHKTPVEAVRYGVDADFFTRRSNARSLLRLPPDAFLIGFFGAKGSDQDENRKGVPVLIEVLKTALPLIPKGHIVFAGSGWEPLAAELRALNFSASCLGYIRRAWMPDLFSAMDVYLMTSRVEGGPCTILESMACSTPVVATRVGLVPDVVSDGVDGFTAEVGDVADLAAAIVKLAADRDLAQRIGAAALRKARLHSWPRNLQPLEELYRRYSRPATAPENTSPRWMRDTGRFRGAAYAADGFARTLDDVRRGGQSVGPALKRLHEMLDGISFKSRLRGAAMLKRLDFRS